MKKIEKLTALKVKGLSKRGRYCDGDGLYLQVAAGGSKQWLFRYQRDGRSREMGLGSARIVSLVAARKKARAVHVQLEEGNDPIEVRRLAKEAMAKEKGPTFQESAELYIKAHSPSWKSEVHRKQWQSTLQTYVFPVFGKFPVNSVDTDPVLKVLQPIWITKPETASRIRGRIEMILDWSKAHGYRSGENPARHRGHLDKLLPKHSRIRRVRHQPALSYKELPAFFTKLRKHNGVAAKALEFTILTATRTSEVVAAKIEEFDFDGRVWTIPAQRMKARREHRVPLSAPAIEIIRAAHKEDPESGFVFIGNRPQRPLSNMAMLSLLKTMRPEETVHGFRSTFRDWARETTNFPREDAEAALAHVISNKAEAAYARGDVLEKRRQLMAQWAAYCLSIRQTQNQGEVENGQEKGPWDDRAQAAQTI